MWDAWQPAGHLGLLARQPLNLDLVWAALGLVAAVLAGVLVILWVQRWQKRAADPGDPVAELENYRALFERGAIVQVFGHVRSAAHAVALELPEPVRVHVEPHGRSEVVLVVHPAAAFVGVREQC